MPYQANLDEDFVYVIHLRLLAARVPGKSPRVAALTQLFAAHLVQRYPDVAPKTPAYRGGLPIRQLRKVLGIVCTAIFFASDNAPPTLFVV